MATLTTDIVGKLPKSARGRWLARGVESGALKVETPSGAEGVVRRRLEADLRGAIAGEVRFDAGSRALYATDASNYRQVPIGVVVPRTVQDVERAIAICRQYEAPILSRGGGTSLAGQCCNVAVVMDFSKYLNRVLQIDPEKRLARVQPGCVLDVLNKEALRYGLRFGPDPATHNHCTLGGMIGNNSCGVHSVAAGRTVENVEALEVLTYRGQRLSLGATSDEKLAAILARGGDEAALYRKLVALRDRYADLIREKFPPVRRRSSGFPFEFLLPENGLHLARAVTGTESTCVTLLEATVNLMTWPRERSLLVLGYDDVFTAADHVPFVLEFGPIGLEGMDDTLVEHMKKKRIHPRDLDLLPDGGGWLLVEFGGDTKQDADDKAKRLMAALKERGSAPSMRLYDDPAAEEQVWKTRESGLGATAFVPGEPDTWEGWEDSSVAPAQMGDYLREFKKLLHRFDYDAALYGHFGDGCLHCRIDFKLDDAQGIAHYRDFIEHAADLVVKFGGSFSGEHGDGQSRGELLPKMFGDELVKGFKEYKAIWDPDWKMNPGKVVEPYRMDQNLRLGAGFTTAKPKTHFAFQDDQGRMGRAVMRCVGVGECRKLEGGYMCPSYRATREEAHSTRGRAHLLFELLDKKGPLDDGWKDPHVKEALDLCLACKACKSECPLHVDMATYKAEFLSHYYDGRLRPRSAYAMGYIDVWAKLASFAPQVANFFGQTPGFARVAKALGGIAQERTLPKFAPMTFQRFVKRRPMEQTGQRVVLWPDTFTNYLQPDVAKSALEVLESVGASVVVPSERVCCGRPLYDFGMLDRARRLLVHTVDVLRPYLREGLPVIVLEPSCAAVFRDELKGMLPDDPDAALLTKQVVLLSEYLEKREIDLPRLERKAVVQGHCHQKSVFGLDSQKRLLDKLGLDAQTLDAGCCGMAGSFGFEAAHYDVSIKVGEGGVLPKVRAAPDDALVIADGFSCREQIEQETGRQGLHVAQALALARRYGERGPRGRPEDAPELHVLERQAPPLWPLVALGVAGVLTAAAVARRLSR